MPVPKLQECTPCQGARQAALSVSTLPGAASGRPAIASVARASRAPRSLIPLLLEPQAAGRFSGEGAALTLPKMAANIAASTLGNIVGAGVIGGYMLSMANGPDPWHGEKAVTRKAMRARS